MYQFVVQRIKWLLFKVPKYEWMMQVIVTEISYNLVCFKIHIFCVLLLFRYISYVTFLLSEILILYKHMEGSYWQLRIIFQLHTVSYHLGRFWFPPAWSSQQSSWSNLLHVVRILCFLRSDQHVLGYHQRHLLRGQRWYG